MWLRPMDLIKNHVNVNVMHLQILSISLLPFQPVPVMGARL
jgi:hypothetical protein